MSQAAVNCPPTAEEVALLRQLFLANETALLRFAYSLVKEASTAQDIVQEAFVRLQPRLSGIAQARPWLFGTVRNLCIDHLRAGQRRPVVPAGDNDPELAAPADRAPDHELLNAERASLVRVCIERLEPRERTLLRLKYEEGLSYADIAERQGIKPGYVGYQLHHALRSLETHLRKEGLDQ